MAQRDQDTGLLEETISISFPNKVTKGGRTLSVAALVAVGDGKGRVGLGYGKARAVPMAIDKAKKEARRTMVGVHLVGDTVAHAVVGRQDSALVLLRPASPGTGVKAGATVRALCEVVGIRNVLTKVRGSNNAVNVAKATLNALRSMRAAEDVSALRGVEVRLHHPQARVTQEAASPGAPAEAGSSPETAIPRAEDG
jgi:small subunit ribosomal protein S5